MNRFTSNTKIIHCKKVPQYFPAECINCDHRYYAECKFNVDRPGRELKHAIEGKVGTTCDLSYFSNYIVSNLFNTTFC